MGSGSGWILAVVLIFGLPSCCPKSRYKARVQEAIKLKLQTSATMARNQARAYGEAGGEDVQTATTKKGGNAGKGEEASEKLPKVGLTREQLEALVRKATANIDPVTADGLLEKIRQELGPTPEEVESTADDESGQAVEDEPLDEEPRETADPDEDDEQEVPPEDEEASTEEE
jgi:hypothetical protein